MNSNLDVASERRILATLEALHGRMMIVLIIHRLASARPDNHIHVLQGGRIAQSGLWDALLAERNGLFRALWGASQSNLPDATAVAAATRSSMPM